MKDVTRDQELPRETPEQRAARVRSWTADTRPCTRLLADGSRCGLRRINVVHEPDPANAPEGADYYAAMRTRLHPFQVAEHG